MKYCLTLRIDEIRVHPLRLQPDLVSVSAEPQDLGLDARAVARPVHLLTHVVVQVHVRRDDGLDLQRYLVSRILHIKLN